VSVFIDEHRASYGVEPICRALQVAPSTYYAVKARECSPAPRTLTDRQVLAEIRRVYDASGGLYGARKVWWQLEAEDAQIARCTVERLMRREGLAGVVRGKRRRTTIADEDAVRPADLVCREFTATAPNQLWVADFTYVATWSGVVYVAFVIDAFSRRIVGWKADTTMKTSLVLDTLEMALWTRRRHGLPVGAGLVHHNDAGSQYTSFAFTQRLVQAGIDASVGSVGDAYDNALAESTIGLYKAEKIEREAPWKTLAEVELATLEWVDWFNTARLHSACGRLSPAQYEQSQTDNIQYSMTTK
jgi:putative transposase